MFALWIILALAAFVGAFFTPVLVVKIIGLVFGGMNCLIILTWFIGIIQGIRVNNVLNSGK